MKREHIEMIWDSNNRYLLKKQGDNILVVMWINPSTADDKKPDATMRKVMWFAEKNWYDGFAMINVIPQRATNPNNINSNPDKWLFKKNYEVIENLMESIPNPAILLAFWNTIDSQKYFRSWLGELVNILKKYNPKFLKIWLTKDWNPLHPSRAWYCKLTEFNIDDYTTSKSS